MSYYVTKPQIEPAITMSSMSKSTMTLIGLSVCFAILYQRNTKLTDTVNKMEQYLVSEYQATHPATAQQNAVRAPSNESQPSHGSLKPRRQQDPQQTPQHNIIPSDGDSRGIDMQNGLDAWDADSFMDSLGTGPMGGAGR